MMKKFLSCSLVNTCPALPNPAGGSVDVLGNTPGDMAIYSCNANFVLDGEESRVCGLDGEWEGVEPVCEGMYGAIS